MTKQIRYAVVAATMGLGLGVAIPAIAAQPAAQSAAQSKVDLSAFAGRWQMNAAETKMGRMGPTGQNLSRSPTFSWVFTPEGQGLRFDVYTSYPQPEPTRTMTLIPDGKLRNCDTKNKTACLTGGGEAKDQTYVYTYIDPHMVTRVFYIKGEVYEYSHYTVSRDGKKFTSVSWGPDTPQWHNIQVFDKVQ